MDDPGPDPFGTVNEFLRNHLGLSPISLASIAYQSDWAQIISLHAYVETTLNFLIVRSLGRPELEEIIARLDVSDRKRGKMAFVKSLNLLSSDHRSFIHKLSELRNTLVHNAKNIDFKLGAYLKGLDPNKRNEIKKSIVPVIEKYIASFSRQDAEETFETVPGLAVLLCVMAVMTEVYGQELVRQYISMTAEPAKSTPKES